MNSMSIIESNKSGAKINFLMISSDGLNADAMSVYGHKSDTTPFLRSIAEKSLIFKNAYANCNHTDCSIASMISGKHPLKTQVIYENSVFQGVDAREHWVGQLKQLGYSTFDVSVPQETDALTLNLVDGFDYSNGGGSLVSIEDLTGHQLPRLFPLGSLLLDRILERAWVRMATVAFFVDIRDPFAELKKFEAPEYLNNTAERLDEFLSVLASAPTPFFGHLHLMTTHGPYYSPTTMQFSKGLTQSTPWETGPHYEDSILEFDRQLSQIFDALERKGVRQSTVVIISTDHGNGYTTQVRLPLIIATPDGTSGIIEHPVQYLDIAPTIYDYMRVAPPIWLDGHSLLNEQIRTGPILTIDRNDVIFSNAARGGERERKPELTYNLIDCDKLYALNSRNGNLKRMIVSSPISECVRAIDDSKTDDEIRNLVGKAVEDAKKNSNQSILVSSRIDINP